MQNKIMMMIQATSFEYVIHIIIYIGINNFTITSFKMNTQIFKTSIRSTDKLNIER